MSTIFTIGHSVHPIDTLVALLQQFEIAVLVDTRSSPYSRFAQQFDRDALHKSLQASGVQYLFMGDELGGRPVGEMYYDGSGRVLYGKRTSAEDFRCCIERLERGMAQFRIALLCSEEDPAHCHRRLLVGRVLVERGHELLHIRGDGRCESEATVAVVSGKLLVTAQPALFAELNEDQWKSTVSVSPRKAPASFSTH